jgi:L-rhamnose isomerase/sugar isomerase
MQILKTGYNTDVNPIVAMARFENGNSIDPINTYRTLDYKKNKSLTRKNEGGSSSGIV